MRLINIDELKGCAIIRPHSRADMKAIESCSEVVLHDDIPTAYDIDKVVERLEGEATLSDVDGIGKCYAIDLQTAVIIVTKGGAE